VNATTVTIASAGAASEGLVVICTKDRPDEIVRSCTAVHRSAPRLPILVLDASAANATRDACRSLRLALGAALPLSYRRAQRPGLARQRNEAVAVCRELRAEIVHFIDDDTEVSSGYFDAIERRFAEQPEVIGVGGVVENQPRPAHRWIKRMFLLESARPGAALISGRNSLGQYPGSRPGEPVDWLSGCSMSYRLRAFDEHRFDDRLEGYSLGEDFDFSFRLSRRHPIVVDPAASCTHHLTPTARDSLRARSREGTITVHRWVRENRHAGMALTAFWWSTLGDALLHGARWLVCRDNKAGQELRGILEGAIAVIRPG